jgi:hypothetical protein
MISMRIKVLSKRFAGVFAGVVVATACSSVLFAQKAHGRGPGESADNAGIPSCRVAWMPASVPDICDWKNAVSLPNARSYLSAVAAAGHLYVAGGFQWDASAGKVVYYNDVLSSAIDEQGGLGPWKSVRTFKNGRSGLGMAATRNCLIIAGGSWSDGNSAVYSGDVQTARIGDDGALSEFVESPHRLNIRRSNHTLIAYEGATATYLYAVAGVTQLSKDTVHLDSIELALIDSKCNVGPWTTAHFDIKGGRSTPQAVLVGNILYVIGGWGDLDLVDVYSDVQYAAIGDDGSLSPWKTSAHRLPSGIYGHATSVIPAAGGQVAMLLVTGGEPSTGVYSSAISYSYLVAGQLPSLSSGPWAMFYKTLPSDMAGHAAVYSNGFLYLVGGSKSGGVYLSNVIYAKVSPGTP